MKIKSIPKLAVSLAIPQIAGVIGSFFTAPAIGSWYANLIKPELTPPDFLFAPVWTILFLLMGIAVYIVWTGDRNTRKAMLPLAIFDIQLVLNVLWSYLFFGLRSPLLGLAGIIVLWVAIAVTIVAFYRVSRTAGYLLIPYIVWVSFAAFLNWQILAIN